MYFFLQSNTDLFFVILNNNEILLVIVFTTPKFILTFILILNGGCKNTECEYVVFRLYDLCCVQ